MESSNVIRMCNPLPVFFTLEQANALLPLLRRISERHDKVIKRALKHQRYFMRCGAPQTRITEMDNLVVKECQAHANKVLKLGVKMFQGGYYGFDTGYGYFSWLPNEEQISYYHDYLDQPRRRRQIGILRVVK